MMMQAIREKAGGILGYIILGAISIIFALWGVENYLGVTGAGAVATVDGEEIGLEEFQRALSNDRRQMLNQGVDPAMLDDPIRRREILEQLVDAKVWEEAGRQSDMRPSAAALRQQIEATPSFQVDGRFNSDAYVQLLGAQGYSPRRYETELGDQLLLRTIPMAISLTTFSTPAEVDRLKSLQNQTRDFEYLVVNAADFLSEIEPTEEQITEYYEANSSEFVQPEQAVIEYIELSSADYTGDIEVDEATLRRQYEVRKDSFMTAERRLTSHILIEIGDEGIEGARAEAQRIADLARDDGDFSELAQEFSTDIGSGSEGGDLGWVTRDMMVAPFEEALFAMEEGTISDPVQSGFGFHVIWLREVDEARGKSFEEAREQLAADYRTNEAERQFLTIQDDLQRQLTFGENPDLATTAEEYGLDVQTAGPFSRTEGEGIAQFQTVRDSAFSDLVMLDNLISDPVAVDDSRVVFLRIIETIPAGTKPLEEVRTQIVNKVKADMAADRARSRAEDYLAQLQSGVAPESLSTEDVPAEFKSAESAGRNGGEHNFLLTREVFKLPRPADEPSWQMVEFGGNQFGLVKLTAVQGGSTDSEPVDAMDQALAMRVARSHGAAEVAALGTALRDAADVEVNESLINPNL